jgi:hypothetical protein
LSSRALILSLAGLTALRSTFELYLVGSHHQLDHAAILGESGLVAESWRKPILLLGLRRKLRHGRENQSEAAKRPLQNRHSSLK